MNIQAKRDTIHERIASMTEERLDELMPILSNPNYHLSVNEDDSALVAYRKSHTSSEDFDELSEEESTAAFLRDVQKRNAAGDLVDAMDKSHIEMVYNLLEETGDGYVLSEEEWVEIQRRAHDMEKGLVEMIPGDEVLRQMKDELEKFKR